MRAKKPDTFFNLNAVRSHIFEEREEKGRQGKKGRNERRGGEWR